MPKKTTKNKKKQENRGGARANAGRKPTGAVYGRLDVEIKVETLEKIKIKYKESGKTWDNFLSSLVDTQANS